MIAIGFDPGLGGAVAMLDSDGLPMMCEDLPIMRDKMLAWVDGLRLQSLLLEALQGRPAVAYVERVGSMPGQGVASSFKFGVGFGSILSVLQANQLSIELVTPAVWKRAMGIGPDKSASLNKARLLYPSVDLPLVRHHGRAEALLLARYGQRLAMGCAA